jgi:hypothetical protein
MALSEWVDSLPEPWAMVLRFLPITGAFFLGLIVVLLWKRKALPADSKGAEKQPASWQKELKDSLAKNNRLKGQLASSGREMKLKDQELEGLRTQLAATTAIGTAGAKTIPVDAVPKDGSGIEPREELQDFAAASEKLAKAAVQFRQKIRAEAEKEGLGAGGLGKQSEAPPDWDELLLFRSNDPSIWNQSVDGGEDHLSRSLTQVPANTAFLRLRRVDTGEGIVIPIETRGLTGEGGAHSSGFNGTLEEFYGARHLGIFHEGLPQEVETRFAFGGWGFGHRVNGEATQAVGWAGQEISGDTVIEITVFPRLPEIPPGDRLLRES